MKLSTFHRALETYGKEIVEGVRTRLGIKDRAQDAFQNMVEYFLRNKTYRAYDNDSVDTRMLNWLKSATINQGKKAIEKANSERSTVCYIEDIAPQLEKQTPDVSTADCRFCFAGVLNEYRACGECGTIEGKPSCKKNDRSFSVEEKEALDWPNVEITSDVEVAIQTLTELEQKVIRRVLLGNDSLDELIDPVTGNSRPTLYRIFIRAKLKLKHELQAYNLSKLKKTT